MSLKELTSIWGLFGCSAACAARIICATKKPSALHRTARWHSMTVTPPRQKSKSNLDCSNKTPIGARSAVYTFRSILKMWIFRINGTSWTLRNVTHVSRIPALYNSICALCSVLHCCVAMMINMRSRSKALSSRNWINFSRSLKSFWNGYLAVAMWIAREQNGDEPPWWRIGAASRQCM